jgi:short-subunit dehydrogenase
MGREFVLQLSQYVQVDEIWAIARRQDALASLQAEVSIPIQAISMDLVKDESFEAFQSILEEAKPDIRLLVNAAGFGKFGSFDKISTTDDCRMIDLNCKSLVMMTRLCIPYMGSGSHILQLDSLSAFQPVPYITTYGATKAFVLSYSRAMNRELKDRGIRMMALNPGWVKTEFFNHATQTNDGDKVQYYDRLYEADFCVAYGLKDLYRSKKDYSVPGFFTRMQVRLVKLLPHGMVMNTWLSQQKKPKNNKNLTVEGRK